MTARPLTKTDIVNMALDLLNTKTISDIDNPTTETEHLLARWYESVKLSLLRTYNWSFAKSRTTILRTGTPAFGYTDEYKLPNDFIRFLEIDGLFEEPGDKIFEIEGDKILIDGDGATSLNIKYIKNTESMTLFDPLFVNLLVSQLAVKAAYKLTMDKNLVVQIKQLSIEEEMKAVGIFSQERPPKKTQTSRFITAHRGFYYQEIERI